MIRRSLLEVLRTLFLVQQNSNGFAFFAATLAVTSCVLKLEFLFLSLATVKLLYFSL